MLPNEFDPAFSPILRVDELRALESAHAELPLMERAGGAAADVARGLVRGSGPVVVLAGPGNNGGDGFVLARCLRQSFHEVVVVFAGDPDRLPGDAAAAYRAYRDAGGDTVERPGTPQASLVVDALFGIGLARPLTEPYPALVEWANGQQAPVLALDIPTGVDADTGNVREPAVRACATATFIACKPGLLTGTGVDYVGDISVHALGLEQAAHAAAAGHEIRWPALAAALPPVLARRERNVHKGTFGTLAIIGGGKGLVGAAMLAARAATRLGAGKVRVGLASDDYPTVDLAAPETMLRDAATVIGTAADVMVIGCGLNSDDAAQLLVRAAIDRDTPIVLDADALNVIAASPELKARTRQRRAPTLATPHPAEAARLLGVDTPQVQRDRVAAALHIADDLAAHVVLKGAGSVLAYPDGTFDINTSGNVALAAAGSGDVLAGFCGAMLAQKIAPRDALRVAVCVHGAAADLLVSRGIGPVGLAASELLDAARELVNRAAQAPAAAGDRGRS